jgi:hypothetical protein
VKSGIRLLSPSSCFMLFAEYALPRKSLTLPFGSDVTTRLIDPTSFWSTMPTRWHGVSGQHVLTV